MKTEKRISVNLDGPTYQMLLREAERQHRSISNLVTYILKGWALPADQQPQPQPRHQPPA